MPFDPTLPVNNSQVSSSELRGQFTSLNDAITNLNDEVSNLPTGSDVNTAIVSGSAGPVGAVSPLGLTVSDPPTQAEVQAIADKIDEMLQLLQRL